jgi:hypothetical protein
MEWCEGNEHFWSTQRCKYDIILFAREDAHFLKQKWWLRSWKKHSLTQVRLTYYTDVSKMAAPVMDQSTSCWNVSAEDTIRISVVFPYLVLLTLIKSYYDKGCNYNTAANVNWVISQVELKYEISMLMCRTVICDQGCICCSEWDLWSCFPEDFTHQDQFKLHDCKMLESLVILSTYLWFKHHRTWKSLLISRWSYIAQPNHMELLWRTQL